MTPAEKRSVALLRTAMLDTPEIARMFIPGADHLLKVLCLTMPDVTQETIGRVLMSLGAYYSAVYDVEEFTGDRLTARILGNIMLTAAESVLPWEMHGE